MSYTKCPNCRKVQQVNQALVGKDIGCMNSRCGSRFKAPVYRLHSNALSQTVFYFVIAFALFLLFRWEWNNASWIMTSVG
jgi:hypothetical protein